MSRRAGGGGHGRKQVQQEQRAGGHPHQKKPGPQRQQFQEDTRHQEETRHKRRTETLANTCSNLVGLATNRGGSASVLGARARIIKSHSMIVYHTYNSLPSPPEPAIGRFIPLNYMQTKCSFTFSPCPGRIEHQSNGISLSSSPLMMMTVDAQTPLEHLMDGYAATLHRCIHHTPPMHPSLSTHPPIHPFLLFWGGKKGEEPSPLIE